MGSLPVHLIEVTPRELPGLQDTRGESIRSMLSADHGLSVGKVRSITGYQVKAKLSSTELLQSLQDLFTDPIIEHNLDVAKSADWVIDLGPEGGDGGGAVVAVGTPEEVAKHPDSYTGQFLSTQLNKP